MTPVTIEPSLRRRLGWFVLLWSAGVAALGAVALILHLPLMLAR
jgi:hypothetical protein